jgi:hypothetical protein
MAAATFFSMRVVFMCDGSKMFLFLAALAMASFWTYTLTSTFSIYETEGTATSTSNLFLFVNFVSILVLPPITWGGYYLSSSTQSHPISLLRSLSFSLNSLLFLMLDVFIQASYSYIITETFFSENTTALTRFLLRCVAHGFFVQLSIEAVWQYSVRMKNKFGIPEDKASLNIIFYIAMLMTYGRFMQFAATDAYSAVMLEVAGLIAELNTLDKLLQVSRRASEAGARAKRARERNGRASEAGARAKRARED